MHRQTETKLDNKIIKILPFGLSGPRPTQAQGSNIKADPEQKLGCSL